jgi:hypothetical protein
VACAVDTGRVEHVLASSVVRSGAGPGWSTVQHVSDHSECVFCGIVAGVVPSTTIAETERAVAFMDVNPAAHGHALVIPRAHAIDLLDISPEDLAA